MKKIFQFLLVAVAAIAISSCTNVNEGGKVLDKNAININVIAQADNLASDDVETKTYIATYNNVANTILWGSNEYMKLAVTAGETTTFATSKDATANIFAGQPSAKFGFEITPGDADTYTYQGLYPASAAVASKNTNPASYKVNLISTQNATATSYDPAAYIMVAKPETFDEVQTDWFASYRRATALNKITLKNVPSGVSIKRVKITAPTGKYLAGRRYIDLTTGESGDVYPSGSETETVEVKFATPLTGTNVDVWFTSWDVTVEAGEVLTIVAYTTDQKSYTKTITVPSDKSIKFQEGFLNTLGANMTGITPEEVNEVAEGSYVVVVVDGSNPLYALKAEKESGKERLLAVGYNESLESYAGDEDIIWNLTKSGDSYIFKNNGSYLGYKGSSNESYWLEPGEEWTESNYLLDITAQETAGQYYVTVHSNSNRYLSKNSSANFFAFYSGTTQKANLVFVPATVDTRTPAVIAFVNGLVSLTTANYSSFSGQDVEIDPGVDEIVNNIVWSYENESGVIDESQSDGEDIVLTGNVGYAIVKASFAGSENYRPAEGAYRIEISEISTGLTLTFPFTSPIEGWPAAKADGEAGTYTYPLGETNYSFSHTKEGDGIYCQTSYLMIASGNYLGLPAPDGYKLVSVSAQLNPGGNPSTAAKGTITSDTSGTVVAGGEEQTFDTKGGSKTFNLTGTDANTVYYLAISNKNFQCTELVLVYEAAAERQESGMSWNVTTASAEINDTGISFTAPTLTLGNAHDVSYNSTDTGVATVDAEGVVTVLAEGTTTIKAIFAGDNDYKPATAEYSLTVIDNRPACAAPTFSPAAGEVTSGTTITIASATSGATIWYTTGSTEFSEGGWTEYTEPVAVTEACTIKAIAVKSNYKNSEVASATYVITVATVGSGTEQDPYTAGDILDKYPNGSGDALVYVTGRITSITEVSLNFKNATYTISDGTRSILVYRGRYLNNEDFTSVDQIAVNDVVVVYGKIGTHNDVAQLAQGNYITSLTKAPTITVDPESLTWAADKTDLRQITVTTSGNAGFTHTIVSGTYSDWTITATGGTKLSVKPKEANASTTADKVLVLKVKHNTDPSVFTEITCTQFKVNNGTPFTYTLDGTITGSGNAYAGNNSITQNSIDWIVNGNTTTNPWRIGGKNIENVDRAIYSTTAIAADINQIKVGSGSTALELTVNSLTISVHNSAADAASGNNAIATKTVTSGIASATVTFDKEDNTSWAGKYYRIVYNVTRTSTDKNGYILFYSAQFNGTI